MSSEGTLNKAGIRIKHIRIKRDPPVCKQYTRRFESLCTQDVVFTDEGGPSTSRSQCPQFPFSHFVAISIKGPVPPQKVIYRS